MEQTGDYDKRGPDFETFLIGEITAAHIDADRLVRQTWANGFPNWQMFRAVDCGDSLYRPILRDWCVAYAIAYCEAGGVRQGMPAEEIGCLAGWDAYYALMNHKWLIAGMDVADVAGVDPKTYRKVRNHVYAAMQASLRHYWNELNIAIRCVYRSYRETPAETPRSGLASGRGFGHDDAPSADGCYRALPLGSVG